MTDTTASLAASESPFWPELCRSSRYSLSVRTVMPSVTLPLFFRHASIAPGRLPDGATILDIAPTITAWLGVPADPDWEGKVLQ